MGKVAFLNLTINSFTHNNVWKKFFSNGDQSSFNLYLHPKFNVPSLFSQYCIPNTVRTGWGQFSLVEATVELMKAALEDEDNEYFTLLSDSHFPLYDLDTTVGLIKKRYKKMTFSKHFSFHTKVKKQTIFKKGIKGYKFGEYNAVCQFFVCRRRDAIQFVETFDYWSQFFVKNQETLADEFYFWGVAKELGMDFEIGKASTYSDWSIMKDDQGKTLRVPIEFKKINNQMLDTYRDEGYLYVRKIRPDTIVMADPFKCR